MSSFLHSVIVSVKAKALTFKILLRALEVRMNISAHTIRKEESDGIFSYLGFDSLIAFKTFESNSYRPLPWNRKLAFFPNSLEVFSSIGSQIFLMGVP
jgi:hypothetical protein